jgi:hypothetical protein
MGYGLDGPGFIWFPAWQDFSLLCIIQTSSEAHPASYEREANNLPPSSAEVKNGVAIPPLTHVFMA